MINILVDECYAFDYLSILEVKKNMNESDNFFAWDECFNFLKNQIGDEKFNEIIKSTEYNNLYISNLLTFDAVKKAREGKDILAKEVDDCNMVRFKCKVILQNKYFPNTNVREKKL